MSARNALLKRVIDYSVLCGRAPRLGMARAMLASHPSQANHTRPSATSLSIRAQRPFSPRVGRPLTVPPSPTYLTGGAADSSCCPTHTVMLSRMTWNTVRPSRV